MESTVGHVTHPAWWLQLYAWADARKKELAYGGVAVLAVGLVVSYYLYHRMQREVEAGRALSQASAAVLTDGPKAESSDSFLKVANDFSGTSAAGQALLRAAAVLFAEGKHAEAQSHYERFMRDNRESALIGQALFGIAVSLDAQGKPSEAAERYQSLIDRRPNDNMIPQCRLNLARLYEAQNKPAQAKPLYEAVLRASPYSAYTSTGNEAARLLEALLVKHPELKEVKPASTNAPAITVGQP